jgi:hypothetical protein
MDQSGQPSGGAMGAESGGKGGEKGVMVRLNSSDEPDKNSRVKINIGNFCSAVRALALASPMVAQFDGATTCRKKYDSSGEPERVLQQLGASAACKCVFATETVFVEIGGMKPALGPTSVACQ